jgi:hypothetical protein
LGNRNGTFGAPVNYSGGTNPVSIATGDFNGDGKLDLAVGNPNPSPGQPGTVDILLGNGDGSFQAPVSYAVGTYPNALATADFNGDGKLDLAVVSGGDVAILLGNGDGTFQPAVNYVLAYGVHNLVVGDFNNDGKPDLALSLNTTGETSYVAVLLGKGDGTFDAPVYYPLPDNTSAASVAVGDFNGDGKLDLAVAGGPVAILEGNGDGTFQPPVAVNVPYTGFVLTADFNGDGKLDLLVGDSGFNTVAFLLGNGDLTFQGPVGFEVGTSRFANFAIGDFNHDHKPDVAVAISGSIGVLLNRTK